MDEILILLDLSSTFDTMDHKILLTRLENKVGFTNIVLNWINSYLENRKRTVVVSDVNSESYDMLWGVP